MALWICGNLLLQPGRAGWSFGPAPRFPGCKASGELAALIITTLVLMSQRRARDELAEWRKAASTLELTIMNEQKSAKIVALLEEMRRDNPMMTDRIDAEV